MNELVCVDPIRELLPFYLNGSLEPAEAEAVSSHLETCPACARDFDDLADLTLAIERHGTAGTGADTGPARAEHVSRSWLLLVAAVLIPAIAGVAWAYFELRGSRVAPGVSRHVEGTTHDIVFDLAGGPTRDQSLTPTLDLPGDVGRVRFVFFIPVSPGAVYTAQIRNAAGRVVIPERPLGPLDSLGRGSLEALAANLDAEGPYELVAARDEPAKGRTTYNFDFYVRRRMQDGTAHD